MHIISGNSHTGLATSIANKLLTRPITCSLDKFSDGEIQVVIQDNIKNQDIFIIQSGYSNTNEKYNVNDYLMETLIIIDACRRSMAKSVNIIMPYYPYSRQDKKDESRAPITAKLIANLLEKSGIDRLVVMDLHSSQIQGFFDIPVDNIYSVRIVVDYFNNTIFNDYTEEEKEDKFIVVSPDAGAARRTLKFAKCMGLNTAIMHKQRNYQKKNTVEKTIIISDRDSLKGKTAIICDDICDTGGTLIKAVDTLIQNEINDVIVVITHGILSREAIDRINKCIHITKMIVTNSIDQTKNITLSNKIEVIKIDLLIAEVINCLITGDSISQFFK